jgi:hypothetical protein
MKKEREPKYIPSPLNNNMINYKEYYMGANEKIGYSLLIFVIGGLVGLVFYGGLFKSDGDATLATHISNAIFFCIVGIVALKFFMKTVVESLKDRRAKKLQKQFMDLLENLSFSLSSGNTVNDAFLNARGDLLNQYTEKDMIIIELNEIVNGIQNGKTLEEMMQSFGKRSGNEDIENFGNVISNCYRLGGDFNSVVRKTRVILGDKVAITEEINTKLMSNKLQLNAMCIMPIILVAMLKVSSTSFAQNLSSAVGVIVTTFAIGLFVAAYIWGQKIIDIR